MNLIKLCVGAQNVSDLYEWQKNRLIHDKNLEKFEVGDYYNEAVPNLRKAISKKLKINDNLALILP